MADFDDARAFWDTRYAAPEYIFGTEPNAFLASQAALIVPGMRALDVACGEGRNSVWLASRGCEVIGFDISPLALAKARRLAEQRGVGLDLRLADVRSWDWAPAAFDLVCCVFIQFAAPGDRARLFEGLKTTLRPGGWLLMQGYTPKQVEFGTGGPPDVAHMYTPSLLEEAFADLEIVLLREHEAILAEGTKHVGQSALVDLVARKPAR
jgi:SAM-dependent methyltransferase